MNEYTSDQIRGMVGVSESRLKKWCLELEKQKYSYKRVKAQRFFTDEDYLLLCDLKEIMDSERLSLKEGVRRVLLGVREVLPTVDEQIPQDRGDNVTNLEVMQVLQKGFIDQQTITTGNAVVIEEGIYELKHMVNTIIDHIGDLQSRMYGVENLLSITHEEVVTSNRLTRDIATDLRHSMQNKKRSSTRKGWLSWIVTH